MHFSLKFPAKMHFWKFCWPEESISEDGEGQRARDVEKILLLVTSQVEEDDGEENQEENQWEVWQNQGQEEHVVQSLGLACVNID